MSSFDVLALQLPVDASDPALAQQQSRFNQLLAQLDAARAALAEWQARWERWHEVVEPARRELLGAWREWVFALDAASLQPEFGRGERRQLEQLLQQTARELLQVQDDPELAALLQRHDPLSAPVRGEDADDAATAAVDRQHAAESDRSIDREDDREDDWERQAAAAAARRQQAKAQKRAAASARRQQQAQQEASGSLREVYRKLASALHPDREPDPAERARKTALMQQANQAYAEENLMALLELQLQAERITSARRALPDPRRLEHYLAVLQEQLEELQTEARRLEAQFRAATGGPPGTGMPARKADRLVGAEAQRLREDARQLRLQARGLQDVEAARQWLRALRRSGAD